MITTVDIYTNDGHDLLHSEITDRDVDFTGFGAVEDYTELSGRNFTIPCTSEVAGYYLDSEDIYQVKITNCDDNNLPIGYAGFARVAMSSLGDDEDSSLSVAFTHSPRYS